MRRCGVIDKIAVMAIVRAIRIWLVANVSVPVFVDRIEGRLRQGSVGQHPSLFVSQRGVTIRAGTDRRAGLSDTWGKHDHQRCTDESSQGRDYECGTAPAGTQKSH